MCRSSACFLPHWCALIFVLIPASPTRAQDSVPAEVAEPKQPTLLAARPIPVGRNETPLRRLLVERYNEAVAEMILRNQDFRRGRGTLGDFLETGSRVVQAGLEVRDKLEEQISLLEQYVELVQEGEKMVTARYQAGRVGEAELHQTRYLRMDAEIRLLRLKERLKPREEKGRR